MLNSNKKSKKIYISGKMTGMPKNKYRAMFKEVEDKLIQEGNEPINPSSINYGKLSYSDILVHDLQMLAECDAIYLLPNWSDSKGAKAELAFAEAIGLEVLTEDNV